jgi:hypothetical protein
MVLPYEQAAINDEEMPIGLHLSEQKAFFCLRALYREYKNGTVGKEQAIREKQKIIKQLEDELSYDNIILRIAQLWPRIEEPARDYRKNRTLESADKFIEAVYQVGMPE